MMRSVFIDTAYWIAQFNSKDSLHVSAMELEKTLVGAELLTSELVLVEFLNFFCKFGSVTRKEVSEFVQFLLPNAAIEIVWQTPDLFSAGVELYYARLDKGYSLTDCVSMVVMRERAVMDVLTSDRHFAQEGFNPLL